MKVKKTSKNIKAKEISMVDKTIGTKITYARTALGITMKNLAEKLGITHQQLYKYETGINRITASRLLDISRILQIHIIFFFEELMEKIKPVTEERHRTMLEIMHDLNNIHRKDQIESVKAVIRTIATQ